MYRQQGFGNIIIIAVIITVLTSALAIVAWKNIGPGKHSSDQVKQTTTPSVPSTPSSDIAPIEPTNLMANTKSDSSSIWAGYVASGKVFNEAEGRVKVPIITCNGKQQTFGAWVGFDGWGGLQSVEQTGVTATCDNASAYVKAPPTNGVYYYAWSAMHGAGSYKTYDFAVRPDDIIHYKISYADGVYTMTVKNETTGQSGTNIQKCIIDQTARQSTGRTDCPRMYAEWIVERPGSNQMADFGSVVLYDNTATDSDGNKTYIEGFTNSRVDMIQNKNMLANTFTLAGRGAFTVAWTNSGIPGE
ncbi:MAG: G1 family glutamic endopeptidase [Candidatus Saccharimonadales bacterium]